MECQFEWDNRDNFVNLQNNRVLLWILHDQLEELIDLLKPIVKEIEGMNTNINPDNKNP